MKSKGQNRWEKSKTQRVWTSENATINIEFDSSGLSLTADSIPPIVENKIGIYIHTSPSKQITSKKSLSLITTHMWILNLEGTLTFQILEAKHLNSPKIKKL